ncbi:MAG: flavodoxin family protein [Firmicutes bacterium]|nr:flavodoxin family protein [Bacillota bacterium]
MSNILAISASPRRNGNSELALRSFCRAAEENGITVELIRLQELRLEPCRGCELCEADGICVVKDKMQPLYEKVAAVKGLVLATPIYFGSLSAQLKIFMDRFQSWWQAKYRLDKPFVRLEDEKIGYIISTGALQRPDFADNAVAIAKVYFHSINYHYGGSLSLQGLDRKGEINADPAALDKAYDAGKEFVSRYLL